MATLYISNFKRGKQREKVQSISANSCKLMNEWEGGGSSPGMATEARTVLGPVSTICGSALKIALYIYIQTESTHITACHTHTHTRQWEPSGSISELKHLEIREYRHHTSSPALFAFPLPGRAAEEEGHPLFKSILMKQRMWDSLSWDWHFFCVAVGAAMHARLEWMQLALLWRWAAYELCTDGEIGRGGWRKRM